MHVVYIANVHVCLDMFPMLKCNTILVNKKSYGLKKGEHIQGWYKKERRQDRDGECCELKDGDGEWGVMIPRGSLHHTLYRRTVWM